MTRKLIISNATALAKRYKAPGLKAIQMAIARLALSDSLRGISTEVAWLDAPGAGLKKVASPGNRKATKAAIDALYKKHGAPDYLVILGGPDIVAHQSLVNPVALTDNDEPDADVPSDLPYACDTPYSRDIDQFLGPTRVVGRIPDVWGSRDPILLIKQIDNAGAFVRTPVGTPFTISARIWKSATAANLRQAFGKASAIGLSPADGPVWPEKGLRSAIHFINCHGAPSDPTFYGDDGNDMPIAHLATKLTGYTTSGAVVVAECCYGAELYEPSDATGVGIAQTYLHEGAIAFCGSTNVAYGQATAATRCYADILCSLFMKSINGKSSTGRALLEARQVYIKDAEAEGIDAVDLKTLAQFLLLGDPSLRPFGNDGAPLASVKLTESVMKSVTRAAGGAKSTNAFAASHKARRTRLKTQGESLEKSAPSVVPSSATDAEAVAVARFAAKKGVSAAKMATFSVRSGISASISGARKAVGAKAAKKGSGAATQAGRRFHVLVDAKGPPTGFSTRLALPEPPELGAMMQGVVGHIMAAAPPPAEPMPVPTHLPAVKRVDVWVIRSSDGKVVSYRKATSKSRG